MGSLVGSVTVTPERAVPGESILFEVFDLAGAPLVDQPDAYVRINGITGARQYLQFPIGGRHRVSVSAWRAGLPVDDSHVVVEIVAGSEPVPEGGDGLQVRALSLTPDIGLPLLNIAHTPDSPATVGLSVGTGTRFFSGLTTGLARSDAADLVAGVSAIGHLGMVDVSPLLNIVPFQNAPTTYRWDFGDGSTATTNDPNIAHDFSAAFDADTQHRLFDVRVRIERQGEQPVEVVRTLSMFSAYAICKSLGTIVPRSRCTGLATKVLAGYAVTVTVDNIEPVPITLTERFITAVMPDDEELALPVRSELPKAVTIGAHSTVAIPVTVGKDVVTKEANALVIVFSGTTANGEAVRVETYADISNEDRKTEGLKIRDMAVTHLPSFVDALKALVEEGNPPIEEPDWLQRIQVERGLKLGRVGGFGHVVQETPELRATHFEVLKAATGVRGTALTRKQIDTLGAQVAGTFGIVAEQSQPLVGIEHVDGANLMPVRTLMAAKLVDKRFFDHLIVQRPEADKECDPDNVPDDIGDWVCQATSEKVEAIMPGRFMNARKGDVVLSPGGMGPIGGLLRQVMPPQRYAHCGIMTRNYDTITHSTATDERLMAYPVGSILGDPYPTEGHRPDVVKYAWPGVVTQRVEEAVHGSEFVDPESGKKYKISAFSARNQFMEIGGVWEVVPPLVVKPDPMVETPELRRQLHAVADAARDMTGKSHYRFYCYTDPTIAENSVAPPDAGWAAGTVPTVCSSFVWLMMKRAGIRLETPTATVAQTDLEPADVVGGAQRNDATRDGLYLYAAGERRAAADYLFNYLHEKVRVQEGESGLLGELAEAFSDMADDVANQMVNAFASDWCDQESKDSDDWKNTVDANAVSPDNILWWDGPDKGGVFGYVVPLVYREPRREELTVHRWKLVPTKGRVRGVVRQNGAPVAGAMVQLYDGMTDFTDTQGRYDLKKVPFGTYQIKAAKDGGPVFLTASAQLVVEEPEMSFDIDLTGPSEDFRMLKISGNIHMIDYEDFGDHERADQPFYAELFVGPYNTHAERTFVGKCGGEIRVEFRVVADWQMDRSIGIYFEHKFFEGASEDTDDLDGRSDKGFGLAAGWWQSWNSDIVSGNAGESHIAATFENALNSS